MRTWLHTDMKLFSILYKCMSQSKEGKNKRWTTKTEARRGHYPHSQFDSANEV